MLAEIALSCADRSRGGVVLGAFVLSSRTGYICSFVEDIVAFLARD